MSELQNYTATQFKITNTNMTTYTMQPVMRIGASIPAPTNGFPNTLDKGYDSIAKLSRNPRTLLFLWHEYLYGISENMPAKNFTSFERAR
jgi:hypothetical protein